MSARNGVEGIRPVADLRLVDRPHGPGPESISRTRADRDHLRTWLWATTLVWIVGMATVFPIDNDALEAVSVLTFDRIAFLAVAALFGLTVARNPAMLRQWDRVEVMMALYLAVIVTSWAMTLPQKHLVDVKRDVNLLLNNFCMPYVAFLIARHCAWTRWQVVTAFGVVVVGIGTFLIAVGFFQGLVDWRFLVAAANQNVHQSRARAAFQNAVPYSVVLALLVPSALLFAMRRSRRIPRVLSICLCVGCAEALVLGQVRIVWLAVPVALLYLAAVCVPLRRSAVWFAAGLLATVGLATAGLDLRWMAGPDGTVWQPHGTLADRLGETESVYNRVAVYATALNMIAHRPLFGFGFGAHTFEAFREPYYASCCGVSPEWAVVCAVPHNEVLNVLVLMGVAGLLVYLGLLRELWRLLSASKASTADPLLATMAACVQADFIILIITAQMHDVMYLHVAQVLFFFLAGLIASRAPRQQPGGAAQIGLGAT